MSQRLALSLCLCVHNVQLRSIWVFRQDIDPATKRRLLVIFKDITIEVPFLEVKLHSEKNVNRITVALLYFHDPLIDLFEENVHLFWILISLAFLIFQSACLSETF